MELGRPWTIADPVFAPQHDGEDGSICITNPSSQQVAKSHKSNKPNGPKKERHQLTANKTSPITHPVFGRHMRASQSPFWTMVSGIKEPPQSAVSNPTDAR